MRTLLAGVAIVATLTAAAHSYVGKAQPLVSQAVVPFQIDRNVEEYGFPVWNPTNCTWDPDDHYDVLRQGDLDAGSSVTFSGCLIAQPNPLNGVSWAVHPRLRLSVTSNDLISASICYQPQGWCIPVDDLTCPSGPYYDPASSAIVEIPDSLGGYGVPTRWVLTIRNSERHRARVVWVLVQGGNDQDQCPGETEVSAPGSDYTFWRQP